MNEANLGKYDFERELSFHESFIYALCPQIENNGFFSGSKD